MLFDELGVNAQCRICNRRLHGEQLLYRQVMVRRHGEEIVQALEMKRHMRKKLYIHDLDLIYMHYRKRYEDMLAQKSTVSR